MQRREDLRLINVHVRAKYSKVNFGQFVYVLDPRKVAACTSILRIQRPETAFFELYTAQIRFHALLRGSGCAKRLEGRGGAASPFIASISNFRLLFAAIFAASIHLDSQNVYSI
ncbi:Hypothetical_protein [Hexamita inflata]|uniref:Hypothetical_protein n=1 Tax=Hexamita inflata TaxID=28002 RepID=A0AA86UDG6_9EUKA|nr:Hypothetical protein HINF_LOCUS41460 [Hexamita inflata]